MSVSGERVKSKEVLRTQARMPMLRFGTTQLESSSLLATPGAAWQSPTSLRQKDPRQDYLFPRL
jgi:hypothetical protein